MITCQIMPGKHIFLPSWLSEYRTRFLHPHLFIPSSSACSHLDRPINISSTLHHLIHLKYQPPHSDFLDWLLFYKIGSYQPKNKNKNLNLPTPYLEWNIQLCKTTASHATAAFRRLERFYPSRPHGPNSLN